MKTQIIHLLILISILSANAANAQSINWGSLKPEYRHLVNVNTGMEHGFVYGLGYGYHFHNRLFSIVPNFQYSFPSGKNLFDDFKMKAGVQISWVEIHHFHFSTNIHGVFRTYENDFTRLLNFGCDLTAVAGYYRPKWFVAGEAGFDKAVVTYFKHSQLYREQYAGVVDGWYEPATGGNFYYGLQAGGSFRRHDLYARGGALLSQDFKTKPTVPFYFQLGYNVKF